MVRKKEDVDVVDKLKSLISEIESEPRKRNLEATNALLKSKLDHVIKRNAFLEKQLLRSKAFSGEFEDIKPRHDSLKKKFDEISRRNDFLEEELSRSRNLVNELKTEIVRLRSITPKNAEELGSARAGLKDTLQHNVVLEKNLIKRTDTLKQLKLENDDLLSQQQLLEKDLFEQNKLNNQITNTLALSKSQLEHKDQQIKHLNQDLRAFNEKLAHTRRELDAFKQMLESEKNKVHLLDDQNKSLLVHLSKAKESIDNLSSNVDFLKSELNQKTKAISESHAKAELDLRAENDVLRRKALALKDVLDDRKKREKEIVDYLARGLKE
jgi:chromosome segregation ATPase